MLSTTQYLHTNNLVFIICSMCRNGWLIALSPCRPAGLTTFRLPSLSPHLQNNVWFAIFLPAEVSQRKMLYWKKRDWSGGLRERKKFSVLQKDCLFSLKCLNVRLKVGWFIFPGFLTIILGKNCVVIFKPAIVLTDTNTSQLPAGAG